MSRLETYKEKDADLLAISLDLNRQYVLYMVEKRKFDGIMTYWRAQLHRGFITKSEYIRRKKIFKKGR